MNWSAAARWTTLIQGVGVLGLFLFSADRAAGQPGLLSSADTAIGIDLDSTFVNIPEIPAMNNGRYPGAEGPEKAIDGLAAIPGPPPSFSKYLNFGGAGSGFIVTPSLGGIPVDSFQITTGNDAPGRDPSMWSLYGFNGALTTPDSVPDDGNAANGVEINPTGLDEAWELIGSGAVALPGDPAMGGDQRGVVGPMVPVPANPGFTHYKFIVDAVKSPGSIMQFAEIQFFADRNDTGTGLLSPTDYIGAVDSVPTPPVPPFSGWKPCGSPNTDCSSSPGGEPPSAAIDQNVTTKYLNFGEQNSGIIITNSEGPVDVNFMRFWTANDAVERDPLSYRLEGTNDPITSEPNSPSNGTETWTLISAGDLTLPGTLPNGGGDDFRRIASDFVRVDSPTAYTSYRLIFPTTKDVSANSMQIADIQFYTAIPEPSTMALVGLMGLAVAAASRRRG